MVFRRINIHSSYQIKFLYFATTEKY